MLDGKSKIIIKLIYMYVCYINLFKIKKKKKGIKMLMEEYVNQVIHVLI